jgi:hypothetical protein
MTEAPRFRTMQIIDDAEKGALLSDSAVEFEEIMIKASAITSVFGASFYEVADWRSAAQPALWEGMGTLLGHAVGEQQKESGAPCI